MMSSCLLASVSHPQLRMCQGLLFIGRDKMASPSCDRGYGCNSFSGVVVITNVASRLLSWWWLPLPDDLFHVTKIVMVFAFLVRRP